MYIIDRYTYYALEFLEKVTPDSKKTMGEFVCFSFHSSQHYLIFYLQLTVCPKHLCISTVGTRKDLFKRDPYKVPITDFFGSVRPVELVYTVPNETIVLDNFVEEKAEKVVKKRAKYYYVPPFVSFSSL